MALSDVTSVEESLRGLRGLGLLNLHQVRAPQSLSGASWVCLLALRACTQDPFARRVM
jgi:hypothetical protein